MKRHSLRQFLALIMLTTLASTTTFALMVLAPLAATGLA